MWVAASAAPRGRGGRCGCRIALSRHRRGLPRGPTAREHGLARFRRRLRYSAAALDLTAPFALIVFELTACGIEGIAQCDVHIFMCVINRMAVTDDDLFIRHGNIDADVVQSALLLVLRRALHPNAAAQNVGAEPLEPGRKFADPRAQRR